LAASPSGRHQGMAEAVQGRGLCAFPPGKHERRFCCVSILALSGGSRWQVTAAPHHGRAGRIAPAGRLHRLLLPIAACPGGPPCDAPFQI